MAESGSHFEWKALLEIIRPMNCLFGALTPVIAALGTIKFYQIVIPLPNLILMLSFGYVTYVLVAAAGNTVNDIYDIEIDKINRPKRVLPRGAMTVRQAKIWVLVLVLSSIVVSYNISIEAAIVAGLFSGVGFLYASKAKMLGIFGNFAVAFSFSFGLVYGGFISSLYGGYGGIIAPLVWFQFLTSAALLIGREVIKGMEDVEGDKIRDVKTIARIYGLKPAAYIAILANIIAIILFTTLWILGWMGLYYIFLMIPANLAVGASTLMLILDYNSKQKQAYASTLDKVGMFLGLITFLIGSL